MISLSPQTFRSEWFRAMSGSKERNILQIGDIPDARRGILSLKPAASCHPHSGQHGNTEGARGSDKRAKRSAPVFGEGFRLTQKQEMFSQAIALGGSNSEAYRHAYDTRKMKPQTVWREALRLRRNPRVAGRIVQLEEEASCARRHSTEWTVRKVTDFLEGMMRSGNSDRARLKAAFFLGRATGMFSK
jgi:hypothetical protein